MITVIVDFSRMAEWVESWEPSLGALIRSAFSEAGDEASRDIKEPADLKDISVYKMMADFHSTAIPKIRSSAAGVLQTIAQEFRRTAKGAYHRENFDTDIECAANYLAFHQFGSHGWIDREDGLHAVFLPDYSIKRSIIAYMKFSNGDVSRKPSHVNLCDNLLELYFRLEEKEENLTPRTIVLVGMPWGFTSYQALRRRNPASRASLVANNATLTEVAIRLGLGENLIGRIVPSKLWGGLTRPIKEIFLRAADEVATSACEPLTVDIASTKNLNLLLTREQLEPSEQIETAFKIVTHLIQTLSLSLESDSRTQEKIADTDRVEMERVLSQEKADLEHLVKSLERHNIDEETVGLLYSAEQEISGILRRNDHNCNSEEELESSQRNVLQLQPLHKRVLGLVEYLVVRKLKQKGVKGTPSAIWDKGFAGPGGPLLDLSRELPGLRSEDLSFFATLEVEGNWLNIASTRSESARDERFDLSEHLYLSELLDGLIRELMTFPRFNGIEITLTPSTPAIHALQLAELARAGSKKSALLTMFLGKIALSLRNFMEHGLDEPSENHGLLIDSSEYWSMERRSQRQRNAGKPCDVLSWLKEVAAQREWRGKLPSSVPSAANTLLLDATSLRRCLVLMSLVLHGANSHLQLKIENQVDEY